MNQSPKRAKKRQSNPAAFLTLLRRDENFRGESRKPLWFVGRHVLAVMAATTVAVNTRFLG
jgi:hypothetical protein